MGSGVYIDVQRSVNNICLNIRFRMTGHVEPRGLQPIFRVGKTPLRPIED